MSYQFDVVSGGYVPTSSAPAYGNLRSAIAILERYPTASTAQSHTHRTRYVCVICLGEETVGSVSLCVPTQRCDHSRCICSGCRTQYLNSMVCAQGITRVPCPQPGCRQQFNETDIQQWGDAATLSRFKYLADIRRTALEHLRMQTSTSRPPPRNKYADEQASAEYIKTQTKSCPGCTAPIVKFGDGCDHMKCAPPGGCGFEFCWLCLCDFEPIRQDGNHRHEPECKHYRPIC